LFVGALVEKTRAFAVTGTGQSSIRTADEIALRVVELAGNIAAGRWQVVNRAFPESVSPDGGWRIGYGCRLQPFDKLVQEGVPVWLLLGAQPATSATTPQVLAIQLGTRPTLAANPPAGKFHEREC
jgi:hypothetical protein